MTLQNLSSAEAKNSAEWIRKDLKKRLWNPKHQEYSRYSDYEKYRLAVLIGIDIPKRIDTKKLKAEFIRELYGEGEPVSSSENITKMSSDPSKKPLKAPGDNTYYPIFKKAIAEKHDKEKSRENDSMKKEDAAKEEKAEKDPIPCTLKYLLDVSEPIIEAILPHKDRYDLIDRLKRMRCRSSETNKIDEIQLRNLVNNVITATYLSVKECCEAKEVFDFPNNLLVLNLEKWVQRLGYVVPEKEKKFFEEIIKSHSVGVWVVF
ncbi:hypothetical protein CAEBREN_22355 [Caenorhabditis brenneri]|uniref:Uncharacterized protein n=1 Tax=Caenorhabditis brenneri TaxID=135651 RepID=G0N9U3_CAEBE|nr:hypothetical protein CAEBREN_22355 [Caenorhabditis brenneri]